MTFVLADRVKETTLTTGTGALTLAGAETDYQGFVAGVGAGNTTFYCVELEGGDEWEVGIGTVSGSPPSLSRDTVRRSSNGGAKVNFSAGSKDVFVSHSADDIITRNDVGVTLIGGANDRAEFAAGGQFRLHGAARVHKEFIIDSGNFGRGAGAPNPVVVGNVNAWEFAIGDVAVMSFEMPNDWAVGTDLGVEVSWFVDDDDVNDDVQFRVDWTACPHNGGEAVDAPNHTGQIDSGEIAVTALAKELRLSEIGIIQGSSLVMGDELGFRLSRIAVAGTNPGDPPAIIHLEIGYMADRLGEAT